MSSPAAALPHLGQSYIFGCHRLPESHLAQEEAFGAEQRRGSVAGRAHGAALGQVGVESRGDLVPEGGTRAGAQAATGRRRPNPLLTRGVTPHLRARSAALSAVAPLTSRDTLVTAPARKASTMPSSRRGQ